MTAPYNALTGVPYTATNADKLEALGFENPAFCTFRQALELGRVVRKGQTAAAKLTRVVTVKDKKTGQPKRVAKAFAVFHVSQLGELEASRTAEVA